ncbi:MAG: pilus assembly protein N-terminal domain-containing protein [Bdellovibrionota bacterium]
MVRSISIVSLWLAFAPHVLAQTKVTLPVGRQQIIHLEGLTRAAIGNPTVADVDVIEAQSKVIVRGLRPGSTDLILWDQQETQKTYIIEVVGKPSALSSEIHQLLDGIEGIEIISTHQNHIIQGYIYRGRDLEQILYVEKLYEKVKNLAKVHPDALEHFRSQIKETLDLYEFDQVTPIAAGSTIFLTGKIPSEHDRILIHSLAKNIFFHCEDQMEVGVYHQKPIYFDIKLLEVSKSSFKDLGMEWPSQLVANSSINKNQSNPFSISVGTQTELTLHTLIEKGQARILSNPSLTCNQESTCQFHAGGQIPIRLVSERVANLSYKNYGLDINLQSKADRSDHLSIDLDIQMSALDYANALEGIPGIVDHQIKNSVDVSVGQTIIIGRLLENRSGKNIKKFPVLGSIPVLGELFKSRSFQKNRSVFMVFITPQRSDSSFDPNERSIEKITDEIENQMQEDGFQWKD